jgi:Uma2 family endonuclease
MGVHGILPLLDPAAHKATYADLLVLGEDVRAEILGGAIEVGPAPLPRHSRAQRVLARQIGGPFDDDHGVGGPGGWWIFIEVEVELSVHDVVRPDVCGWRRERLPDPWDDRPIRVAPDWVCEVLSPSNAANDRVKKRRLYAAHAVPYYWLVDPGTRTLEALHLRDGVWVELGSWGDGDVVRIAPFSEIELDVERLFPPHPDAAG